MKRYGATLLAAGVLAAAGGCSQSARNVDYPPSRGISDDIGATHHTGPIPSTRSLTTRGEPLGAIPWQIDQRHQSDR